MRPEAIIGTATDGSHRKHLMLNRHGGWTVACGADLPTSWLPAYGADVTCGSCRRTVAYRAVPAPDQELTLATATRTDGSEPSPAFGRLPLDELLARASSVVEDARALRARHRRARSAAVAARLEYRADASRRQEAASRRRADRSVRQLA